MTKRPSVVTNERKRGRAAVDERLAYLCMYPLCRACEAKDITTVAVEVDHIVPLFKDGPDTWDNKQGLCKACHADKTADDLGYARPRRIGTDGFPM